MATSSTSMEESASTKIQELDALIINVNDNSESKREAKSPSGNETRNGEADREANASIENEHQNRVLENDITQMLESSEPPLSPKCCIYRVPLDLRKLKEEAYTPQYISIGPFHHGDKRLKTMEKIKVNCFKMFMEKAAVNVKNLVSTIRNMEGDVRCYYAETIQLSSDDCVKMIMLDASFIIMFFLRLYNKFLEEWKMLTDFAPRLFPIVRRDMLLLENQLPFFVIMEIFNLAFGSYSNFPSFTELAFHCCERFNTQKMSPGSNLKIEHFVDLVRTFFLPPPHKLPEKDHRIGVEHFYSVSQLDKAGVKFKKGSSECLFDLKFTNGVFKIPCLKLHNYTEDIFRNLMALEQCHYTLNAYVTDYVSVLDFLIDTPKDVDLLVQKGILIFTHGDSNAVKTWVNNLSKHHAHFGMNSNYSNICNDLKNFYEDPWHNWKATLRRDYFTNPWRTTATVAAIILLVLTFTQTVCSIISLP